jgi:AAA domain
MATFVCRFCAESTAEHSSLEQAMIPQQAMMQNALSPHTPSPLPADADATVTGTDIVYLAGLQPQPVEWLWQHRLAAGTLAMISGEPGSGKTWVALATLRRAKFDIGVRSSKAENLVPGGGLCPRRRTSSRRSTRQDAQINYLSTLSIFMKQTTYLATLPNPI